MHNKIFVVILSAVFLMHTLSSCKKYLDKKSDNSLVVPTTLEDIQGLFDDATTMNQNAPVLGEASADDYFLLDATYSSQQTKLQQFYTWTIEEYLFPNDWSKNYRVIYNCNLALELLEKIPINNQNNVLWNNCKGSALFFRSYSFLNLAWSYSHAYDESTAASDLGIPLRLESDFNVPTTRSSVKATYDKIINDTKESIDYLPDNPQHVFRPSKAAAYGLLARAYLSMRKYDSALKYADACLQIKNSLIDYNSSPCPTCDIVASFNSTTIPFRRFNNEAIFYTELDLTIANIIAPSKAKIDSVLYLQYEDNDLRKKAFFSPNTGYYQFKGNYAQSTALYFGGIATDEMFLIKAECLARLGNKDSALEVLNHLLVNRYDDTFVPVDLPSINETLDRILLERRKELLMRGLRWIDIKRLNKEGYGITPKRLVGGTTYTLQPNVRYYALPLPTDIIKLTNIEQN